MPLDRSLELCATETRTEGERLSVNRRYGERVPMRYRVVPWGSGPVVSVPGPIHVRITIEP